MKRLILLIAFLACASISAFAQGAPPWTIREADNNPRVTSPTLITVSNGTLSCQGKSCVLTTGGGGGSGCTPPGTISRVLYDDGAGGCTSTSGLTATASTITIVSGVTETWSRAGLLYTGTVTTDNASVQTQIIQGDRATVTANDEAYITYRLSNAGGTQTEVARLTWAIPTATAASENGRLDFSVITGGSLAKELQLAGADLSPSTSDGLALGTTSLPWSDLFLASGAVLNYAAGNVVITHSSGILTMGTGELRITTVGTNAASVPTLGSTSTLTNKTLTAPVIATIVNSGTLTLPTSTDTLVGRDTTDTLTNKTLSTSNSVSAALSWADNIRQTFNPGADAAGINVGAQTAEPGTPSNGDLFYDSDDNALKARINGAWVSLGAGGGGSPGGSVGQVQWNNTTFAGISTMTTDGTIVTFAPTVTTGTGATSGVVNTANSLTTGTGFNYSSTSLTSGSLINIASTSTALAAGNEALNIAVSGANGTNAITATGARISVTNTNATSGTNVALELTASGATTDNVAISTTAGRIVQTSASATAFESGPNGGTNPVLRLVNSTASQASGVSITGGAVNAGVTVRLISSGTNEPLIFNSKGNRYAGFQDDSFGTNAGTFNTASWNGGQIGWVSGPTLGSSALDSGFARTAAATVRVTNGSTGAGNFIVGTSAGAIGTSGAGVLAFTLSTTPSTSPTDTVQLYSADAAAADHNTYWRNEAGEVTRATGLGARNSSSFAKTSDTTLATITGLSRNVEAGRTYAFTAVMQTTAAATGGVKFAVSGTATATAISYEGILQDATVTVAQTRATALDTTVCASTTSTAGTCTIRGVIQVSAAGTLLLQFAQNASDGGASTVLANQYFQLIPIS